MLQLLSTSELWCSWSFINSLMEVMVARGQLGPNDKKESWTFLNCETMDNLKEFCDANKLLQTTLTIGTITLPPENIPCFDFLVLLAIVLFLLLVILIVYCCYRCRLKRRWDSECKKWTFLFQYNSWGCNQQFLILRSCIGQTYVIFLSRKLKKRSFTLKGISSWQWLLAFNVILFPL